MKYIVFTPDHRHITNANKTTRQTISSRSQRIGSMPTNASAWLATAFELSAKKRRNTIPATTTDVNTGRNIDDLKIAFTRSLPIFELTMTAKTSGTGIKSASVRTMYRALLNNAFQKTLSFHRRA